MKSNDWRHKNVARYTPGNTKILYFFNCLLDGMHTNPQEDVTLRLCCKRSQKPRFQCLILGDGPTPEWYEAEELISLGACTTPNISEQHSDAGACSLSLILEENAPDKYFLSPKACEGILNRAERRGKHLPPLLQAALEEQSRKTDI